MAIQVSPGVKVSEIDLTTVVPGVSTSVGAIAGSFGWGPVGVPVTVSNQNQLANTFGQPTSLNPQTWWTAAQFLSYGNSLIVSRAANTLATGSYPAYNAIANTGSVAGGAANCVVKNNDDFYNNRSGNSAFPAGAFFVARYPGAIGNSLKVYQCDSVSAYSSNVNLFQSNASAQTYGSLSIAIGSNTALLSFVANTTTSDAANFANTVLGDLTVGDLLSVGNSTIGTQSLSISGIGTPTSNGTAVNVTLNFSSNYLSGTAYTLSNTVNGNTSVINLSRSWQFSGTTPKPTTSAWVSQYGNTSAVDTMSVIVVDQGGMFTGVQGAILETYTGVSRATDAQTTGGATNYFRNVINQNSNYIWVGDDNPNAVSANSLQIASSTNVSPITLQFNSGSDSASESEMATTFGDLTNAYSVFLDKSLPIAFVMQGMPVGGTTVVNGQTVNNFQLANWLIDNIAATRKDVVICYTPDDAAVTGYSTNIAQSLVNWRGACRDSSYGFIDCGYKYIYDNYNNVYRYIPSNGDTAGIMSRTDQTNAPWWSPGGYNRGQLLNVIKMRWNPPQADRDLLYQNSINPIITTNGNGTLLFGDRTSTLKPSAFDRINVRRLFITLENAISQAANYTLFEFNDAFTRSQFVNLITPYLASIQAARGITDFYVQCDSTNNTQEVIDANQFVGSIYVKPNRSINFIQLNFVAVPTGVQFSTVVGSF